MEVSGQFSSPAAAQVDIPGGGGEVGPKFALDALQKRKIFRAHWVLTRDFCVEVCLIPYEHSFPASQRTDTLGITKAIAQGCLGK
jgi:hypothetical protein